MGIGTGTGTGEKGTMEEREDSGANLLLLGASPYRHSSSSPLLAALLTSRDRGGVAIGAGGGSEEFGEAANDSSNDSSKETGQGGGGSHPGTASFGRSPTEALSLMGARFLQSRYGNGGKLLRGWSGQLNVRGGEYRGVMSLCRVLAGGFEAKLLVDEAIARCEGIGNILADISRCKALATQSDARTGNGGAGGGGRGEGDANRGNVNDEDSLFGPRFAARQLGLHYLKRYFLLITYRCWLDQLMAAAPYHGGGGGSLGDGGGGGGGVLPTMTNTATNTIPATAGSMYGAVGVACAHPKHVNMYVTGHPMTNNPSGSSPLSSSANLLRPSGASPTFHSSSSSPSLLSLAGGAGGGGGGVFCPPAPLFVPVYGKDGKEKDVRQLSFTEWVKQQPELHHLADHLTLDN